MFNNGNSSSCLSCTDQPGAKDIKANVAEWGCVRKSINGKVSHFLCLLLTPKFLALNTTVNGAVDISLPSNYPEPTASDQAECEMSSLMVCFTVITLYQETCDMM